MHKPLLVGSAVLFLATGFALIVNFRGDNVILLPHDGVKLQYAGPVYVGDGEWEKKYTAPAHPKQVLTRNSMPQPRNGAILSAEQVHKIRKTHQSVKASRKNAIPKLISKAKPSMSLGEFSSQISNGLSTIFRLHDNPVTMRSPVKILDHV